MPVHDYRCRKCGRVEEHFVRGADLDRVAIYHCATQMGRQVSAPYIAGDYPPYECPVTGRWIEGRRAHEENLKRTGCRLLEPGESKAAMASVRKQNEEAADQLIDQVVEGTAREFGLSLEGVVPAKELPATTATDVSIPLVERSTPLNDSFNNHPLRGKRSGNAT